MIKKLTKIFVLLLYTFTTIAQVNSTAQKKEISKLNTEIQTLKEKNNILENTIYKQLKNLETKTDSLEKEINLNSSYSKNTTDTLQKINQSVNNTTQKINALDNSLTKKTVYWLIGFLITTLMCVVIYFLLRKKVNSSNSALGQQIISTKKILTEENIKLDIKLTELLEKQFNLSNVQQATTASNTATASSIDHSLVLKIADEIVRIQKNITNMDADTKGLKQLGASIQRIQDNFVANGYEMVNLLGKAFDARIKVDAQFIPNETLEKGQEIITRIIKPQVLYKGVMIQAGLVEVSQN